jgi:hypothetical protein
MRSKTKRGKNPSEGKLIPEISVRVVRIPPDRKQNVVVPAQIHKAPQRESASLLSIGVVGCLMNDFASERHHLREIVPELPPGKDPGLLSRTGIQPEPGTAVRCQLAPALLPPDGQVGLNRSGSKILPGAGRRNFKQRKESHRWLTLRLIDEPIFHADLRVGVSLVGSAAAMHVSDRRHDMKLHVLLGAVIDLKERSHASHQQRTPASWRQRTPHGERPPAADHLS